MLLMSLVFLTLNWHLLSRRAHLLREEVPPAYRRTVLRRNAIGVTPYALATIGALISPLPHLGDLRGSGPVLPSPLHHPKADDWRSHRLSRPTFPSTRKGAIAPDTAVI